MASQASQLRQLARIARIKADVELRRFSAFRRHVAALDERITGLQGELIVAAEGAARLWDGTADGGAAANETAADRAETLLPAARIAHALTRQIAQDREAARLERLRLTERFEAARTEAARAFGRAEAIEALDRRQAADRRAALLRRQEGP